MGTRIATNVDSLRGLRSLARANDLQSQTLTRLSTGTQINSGKDNPAGLIGSETLRAQITSIEQSIKNSNRANNVIGTADAALGEVNNLLNQIRGLVQEGVNKGALSQTEIEANQNQIDAALGAINRIAANTSFAGDKLLDGTKSFTTTITSADKAKISDFQVSETLFGSASSVTIDSTVLTAARKGTLTYNAGNLTAATTLQVSGAKGSQVLFFGSGSTYTNVRDAINANTDVTGVSASITTAAVAATLTKTSGAETYTLNGAGANDAIKFVAKRQQADGSNPVSVNVVVAAGTVARSFSVTGNAITINLATTGGAVNGTETASAIAAAVNANSTVNALVTAYAGAGVEGDGSGVLGSSSGAQNLTGGTNNDIRFTDARQDAGASDTAVTVNFVQSGISTARSITVSGTAITVNLATDAAGAVASTETANAIVAAIAANAQASALVTAAAGSGVEGDGTGIVSANNVAQSLAGGVNATLTLTSSEFGSDQFVDINTLNGTFSTYNSSAAAAAREVGTDIVARINGQTAFGKGLKASVSTALLSASVTFASGSNAANVNAKITVTGGGSLFQIGENVATAGQIGVGIDAVNTASLGGVTGKLYELGSGSGKSLLDVRKGTVQGSAVVDIINQARERVNTLRARLGALQKNVIETNISSLGTALENLSDARSSIADTDFAQETANLTKSQILSQAGISTLQIANSAPQQVLSLLRG
jgi:flagellin